VYNFSCIFVVGGPSICGFLEGGQIPPKLRVVLPFPQLQHLSDFLINLLPKNIILPVMERLFHLIFYHLDKLKKIFEVYGEVTDSNIMREGASRRSR